MGHSIPSDNEERFESMSKKIAVIGAGISGLQTACLLAREGNAVIVYEKQEFPPTNPSSMAGGMLSPFSEIETLPMRFVQVGIKGNCALGGYSG